MLICISFAAKDTESDMIQFQTVLRSKQLSATVTHMNVTEELLSVKDSKPHYFWMQSRSYLKVKGSSLLQMQEVET